MPDGSHPAKPKREGKHAGGRPSILTPAVAEEIVERQAQGEPLARICEDAHMPSFRTVFRWEQDDPQFRQLSVRAREIGTHYMAGDCIQIADNALLDPADRRVRIDTRLRLIGKWNRKDYGERQELTGANGGPIEINARKTVDVRLLSDDERELLRELLARAATRQLESPDVIEGEFREVEEED